MSTYTETVKPFVAEASDWGREKATARNRLSGDWLGSPPGDVSMVEVGSIDERAHERGEIEATIVHRLTE